eukprot:TRINITY_DN3754_c0_g2_i1.p1 TRINITY_DN3754_c0_g2~~TRINITY_DN3754_c0_g2_i1.p1  ORF type:complete len:219 (+),score=12.46 TRINITY_DN3754_c0_g2_i1:415-1071(+)
MCKGIEKDGSRCKKAVRQVDGAPHLSITHCPLHRRIVDGVDYGNGDDFLELRKALCYLMDARDSLCCTLSYAQFAAMYQYTSVWRTDIDKFNEEGYDVNEALPIIFRSYPKLVQTAQEREATQIRTAHQLRSNLEYERRVQEKLEQDKQISAQRWKYFCSFFSSFHIDLKINVEMGCVNIYICNKRKKNHVSLVCFVIYMFDIFIYCVQVILILFSFE